MSGMTAFAGASDSRRLTSPPSERSRAACSAGSTDSIEPEVASLVGDIGLVNGAPSVHIHAVVNPEEGIA
jgi:hypothetical protein